MREMLSTLLWVVLQWIINAAAVLADDGSSNLRPNRESCSEECVRWLGIGAAVSAFLLCYFGNWKRWSRFYARMRRDKGVPPRDGCMCACGGGDAQIDDVLDAAYDTLVDGVELEIQTDWMRRHVRRSMRRGSFTMGLPTDARAGSMPSVVIPLLNTSTWKKRWAVVFAADTPPFDSPTELTVVWDEARGSDDTTRVMDGRSVPQIGAPPITFRALWGILPDGNVGLVCIATFEGVRTNVTKEPIVFRGRSNVSAAAITSGTKFELRGTWTRVVSDVDRCWVCCTRPTLQDDETVTGDFYASAEGSGVSGMRRGLVSP